MVDLSIAKSKSIQSEGSKAVKQMMAKQLFINQFFSSGNLLPDPKGSLSAVVPRTAIMCANNEVMKAGRKQQQARVKKRGPYNKLVYAMLY